MTIFKTLIRSLSSASKTTGLRPKTAITTRNLTFHYPPSSSPPMKWAFSCFQGGPLFLSFPPYKLSQSATPLTCRHAAVLGRLKNLEDLVVGRGGKTEEGPKEVPKGGAFGPGPGRAEAGILRSFVNWPNFISVSRLVSGPFIGWMITNEMYTSGVVALAISGATDWLDGYVARKMEIDSVVGSYLDPLADKVLIGSVVLAMVHMDLLHPGLVGLVILRDVGLVGGAVYHRARSLGWKWNSWYDFVNLDGTRPEKVEPLFISKVNTVFQLVLVAAALLQPGFGSPETRPYVTYLSWLVASTTVGSTAAYGAQYMGNRSLLLAKKP